MSNFNISHFLIGIVLFGLSTCPLMAMQDEETTYAGPFGSWAEVKENQGDVSVLGYVVIRSNKSLEFKSATGDKDSVKMLMQTFTDPESFEQIQAESEKFDGIIPVVVSGSFSKRSVKPGDSNRLVTGAYKGPFYDFNIDEVEILSRMEAEATARELIENAEVIGTYLGKVVPLEFENLKVFVESMKVKTFSTQVGDRREVNHSLLVTTKIVSPRKPKTFLNAEVKVSDSTGEVEAIRNVTKLDSKPINKLKRKDFWFKLGSKPEGEVKVEITFKAKLGKKDTEETQVFNYTIVPTSSSIRQPQ